MLIAYYRLESQSTVASRDLIFLTFSDPATIKINLVQYARKRLFQYKMSGCNLDDILKEMESSRPLPDQIEQEKVVSLER